MKPNPLAKIFCAKLVRFGQISLDLGEIWKNQNLYKTKIYML